MTLSLTAQIKQAMLAGEGRMKIAKRFRLTRSQAERHIARIRAANPDVWPPTPRSEFPEIYYQVLELVKDGMGYEAIAGKLQISRGKARHWWNKARASLGKKIFRSRIDEIVAIQDNPKHPSDHFAIAQMYGVTPPTAAKYVQQSTGDYDPARDYLEKKLVKGYLFSEIRRDLQIETIERAMEIIEKNFPDYFIITTAMPDGDFSLLPCHKTT